MSNRAQIVHHIPGRIRIRLPHARGNHALLEQIKQKLSPRPGVRGVAVNPATGSIVIRYDPELHPDYRADLATHAAREKLFALEIDSQDEESGTARSLNSFFGELSDGVKQATSDMIDLKEIFPFAVGTYAFFFVDRTIGAPLWMTLMIFSFSSYMDLHEEEPGEDVAESLDALRAEIAALRKEIRALSR